MVFGIPGDAVTAIAVGVLLMKGMNPGPTIFIHKPQLSMRCSSSSSSPTC